VKTMTGKKLLAHELIGLQVKVKDSSDASRKGLTGKVIDETKHTLKIEFEKGEKIVPKKECIFEFISGKEKVEIEGKKLCLRPEDRTKEYWRNVYD